MNGFCGNPLAQTERHERSERVADQRVAADFVSRKRMLIREDDAQARLRQDSRGRGAGRARADDEHVAA
jgi:hypothetical protein